MLEPTRSTRELENIAENPSNAEIPKQSGILISRRLLIFHLLFVSIALIIVALTVYFFGIKCQHVDLVSPPLLDLPTTEIPFPVTKPMVTDVRLPRDLRPLHYDIRLLPWMEEGNFTTTGFIQILLECITITDKIVLHSAELEIDRTSVQVINFMLNHRLCLHYAKA